MTLNNGGLQAAVFNFPVLNTRLHYCVEQRELRRGVYRYIPWAIQTSDPTRQD
jgi:hypothetical protein